MDDCYSAMIPAHEDCSHLQIGDVIEAKVTGVKPDGKLDITMREKAYLQMDADAEKVMEVIEEFAGVLPFTDKASPEVIMRETGLSKMHSSVRSADCTRSAASRLRSAQSANYSSIAVSGVL